MSAVRPGLQAILTMLPTTKMHHYNQLKASLSSHPKTWLITGVAGFIGSHLLETLLRLNQRVVGVDNFSTGYRHNLEEVQAQVGPDCWNRFSFLSGDIENLDLCRKAMLFQKGDQSFSVDCVLHQAALGSVPKSIEDPIQANRSNVDGFLNVLVAARDAKVKSFVYAASSATYGDDPTLPKIEDRIGAPLSPYAATKLINEIYSGVFARVYGFKSIGLRYFNVFGRRQDPEGAYAAVIPKWIAALMRGEKVFINGDGETTRDFCYIDNVVQANLLAAMAESEAVKNQVYNIAVGEQTSLNQLYDEMLASLASKISPKTERPIYQAFRLGDVKHSVADISKAKSHLGYNPSHNLSLGLKEAMEWYLKRL